MKLLHVGDGHPRNVEFIVRACAEYGIEYHRTHDRSCSDASYDIIWSPEQWIDPDRYPRSKILFGPHFWVFPNPSDPLFTRATPEHAERCVYLCLSDWNKVIHSEMIDASRQVIPFVSIPFGLDVRAEPKAAEPVYDCVLYFKLRHPSLREACETFLQARGLRYKTYLYGSYSRDEYLETLRSTRFVVWIGRHESQGFGLEECLATDTPIYLYDVTSMKEEYADGQYVYQGHSEPLLATAAPYWSDTCGLKVYSQNEFEARFSEFEAALPSFRPAEYVRNTLSDTICFRRFLDALNLNGS